MDRLPPSLLYLVIYNPLLSPSNNAASEALDEDAGEKAHVLFYTAKDHAVSKDRVLRQVGQAKALVNFATIFDTKAVCESVHSLNRRMIMVSPEPDYWIHACIELEKLPRVSKTDLKGKGKQREPVYDCNEASLHDAILRTRLLLGYETFKLTHGSFTSIFDSLGREALELQLERFFTVWAWNWDFTKQVPILDYLGVRVHPLSNQLTPMIDKLRTEIPQDVHLVVFVAPFIVVSKTECLQFPPSLLHHLLSLAAKNSPSAQNNHDESRTMDSTPHSSATSSPSTDDTKPNKHTSINKGLLGVPALSINMNVNMDVRKWSWPGYLTFGIGNNISNTKQQSGVTNGNESQSTDNDMANKHEQPIESDTETKDGVNLNLGVRGSNDAISMIDSQALIDALSSDDGTQCHSINDKQTAPELPQPVPITPPADSLYVEREQPCDSVHPPSTVTSDEHPSSDGEVIAPVLLSTEESRNSNSIPMVPEGCDDTATDPLDDSPQDEPHFFETYAYLPFKDPLNTRRRLIKYIRHDNSLCALVPSSDTDGSHLDDIATHDLAKKIERVLHDLQETISIEQEKIEATFSSPVQNIFHRSQHVVSTSNGLNYTSTSFTASSWLLHEGKRDLESDQELQEVYSRGQSPQTWYLVKRGPKFNVHASTMSGDVYMEIGRKEASLTDVDNEVTAVIRRFLE